MKQLQEAILDEFRENARLYEACDGHFWYGRARQENVSKYIVFHFIDLLPEEEFAYARRLETVRVQFSLFAKGSSTADINEMFEALYETYDRAVLSFRAGDFRTVMMQRDLANLIKEEENYWHYAVDYIIWIQPVTTTTTTAP